MKKINALERRYRNTIEFFSKHVHKEDRILDLGIDNDFSKHLVSLGYNIQNTKGEDLDLETDILTHYGRYNVITAFEILEHLLSPFELLRKLPSDKLIATIPLRLWFASAYRNISDPLDRHYHEFEDWQFDWLLEKSGWKIISTEKWTSPSNKLGIRPMLRYIYPRYYAVYAERH
ncbi:MAG: hypothetical protein KFF49_11110 [Bacteroidales bacterium]|nr:hypothetical protein [Bacteroidales bacterium]